MTVRAWTILLQCFGFDFAPSEVSHIFTSLFPPSQQIFIISVEVQKQMTLEYLRRSVLLVQTRSTTKSFEERFDVRVLSDTMRTENTGGCWVQTPSQSKASHFFLRFLIKTKNSLNKKRRKESSRHDRRQVAASDPNEPDSVRKTETNIP